MCGIIGSVNIPFQNGVRNPDWLELLKHRGPDTNGFYVSDDKSIFLGHTRLSIISLGTNANQPFYSASGRYILVYNGELYNYKELANKHCLKLHTNSDTEVVLELYMKLGKAFLSELNGMFAGAIYDTRTDELFLFRDRLGIKPLYYWKSHNKLAFSSELPALLKIIDKPKIKDQSLTDFLHYGYVPEPNTIYRHVFKFPSGVFALFKNGELNITPYWRAEDQISSSTHSNENKVIAGVEDLLRNSVEMRLMADVPFGTFLSGGADSGLISAIAADISPEPINTFNVSFEDAVFDETSFACEMADIIKSNHRNIRVTKNEVLADLYTGLNLVGEPLVDSSVFPTMAVSKFAAQHVKMALSGDGGDELFMGYGAYTWADRLHHPILSTGRKLISAGLKLKGGNRNRRAATLFDFRTGDSIQSHIASQEQNLFSTKEVEELTGLIPRKYDSPKSFKRQLSNVEEQAFFDLTSYLKDDLLVKVDRSSMHYGLEVRVPFLDHRLVEFSLNIDPAIKRKNNEPKYIVKKIMKRHYPEKLIYRQKWGFSSPLEKWLKHSDYLNNPDLDGSKLSTPFRSIYKKFNSSPDYEYLFNRLHALKCLVPYL